MSDFKRTPLTPLQKKCRKLFTQIGRDMRGNKGCVAVLRVEHQYFDLYMGDIPRTKAECEWIRDMLAIAIAKVPTILLRRKPKTKCKTSK